MNDRDERERLIEARHRMAEMMMRAYPARTFFGTDIAVPISSYPEIISLSRREREGSGIPGYLLSHAGDGNLHLSFLINTEDEREMKIFENINRSVISKALSLGGTATGEHGVGIGKRKFMEAEHGASLEWMKQIKKLFDPNGILNPGKMFM